MEIKIDSHPFPSLNPSPLNTYQIMPIPELQNARMPVHGGKPYNYFISATASSEGIQAAYGSLFSSLIYAYSVCGVAQFAFSQTLYKAVGPCVLVYNPCTYGIEIPSVKYNNITNKLELDFEHKATELNTSCDTSFAWNILRDCTHWFLTYDLADIYTVYTFCAVNPSTYENYQLLDTATEAKKLKKQDEQWDG